jgi:hypothetical protein
MRPNKLDSLSLETLSNQVLEFVGKVRANPVGGPSRWFQEFLGKLLVLPGKNTLAYLASLPAMKEKKFYNIDT